MNFKMEDWEQRRSTTEKQVKRFEDDRTEFERDRARIIHSSAFRRLQSKTQVLGISEGDFRRTRLTHSMEVAQIAAGIGTRLGNKEKKKLGEWLPPRALLEAICFAHDLGHPPFGHSGERALNNAMLTSQIWQHDEYKDSKRIGFEGNGMTLRLLTCLENHTDGFGLDLTRRALLGILKYPAMFTEVENPIEEDAKPLLAVKWSDFKPPKCYLDTEKKYVDWIISPLPESDRHRFVQFEPQQNSDKKKSHGKTKYKSLDCSIMDVADEIAYGVHDFEDGIALQLIHRIDWDEKVKPHYDAKWAASVELGNADEVANQLFSHDHNSADKRKRAIGGLVNALISSVRLEPRDNFAHPLLKYYVTYEGPAKKLQVALQDIIFTNIINSQAVQTLEYRGAMNLVSLFRAIETDPEHLLGGVFRDRISNANGPDRLRVIADYIAGMTDDYATKMFERMFVPRHGTIFDRL